MSRQVKLNREKIIVYRDLIDKILIAKDIELKDFAIKCEISPDTLKAALKRNSLTEALIAKIHDKFSVRKDFLRTGIEPIFEEKPTSDIKTEQADISKNPLVEGYVKELELLRKLVAILERENEELRGKK